MWAPESPFKMHLNIILILILLYLIIQLLIKYTVNIGSRQRHGRKIRSRRVVQKSGEENVPIRSNIPAKSLKYMRDYVTTVVSILQTQMFLLSYTYTWNKL